MNASCNRLIVVRGENQGREYRLPEREATIGRSQQADVVLSLMTASRIHARLSPENGRLKLVSLGRAGTRVDGKPVAGEVTFVTPGQEIEIEGTIFRYEAESAAEAAAPAEVPEAAAMDEADGAAPGNSAAAQADEPPNSDSECSTGRRNETVCVSAHTVCLDEDEMKAIIAREQRIRRSRRVLTATAVALGVALVAAAAHLSRSGVNPAEAEDVGQYDMPDGSFSISVAKELAEPLKSARPDSGVLSAEGVIGKGPAARLAIMLARIRDFKHLALELPDLLRAAPPRIERRKGWALAGKEDTVFLAPDRLVPGLRYEFTFNSDQGGFMAGKGLLWRSGTDLFSVELCCEAKDLSLLCEEMEATLDSCVIRDCDLANRYFPAARADDTKSDMERRKQWREAERAAEQARDMLANSERCPQALAAADARLVMALQSVCAAGRNPEDSVPEWLEQLAEVRERRMRSFHDCEFRIDQAAVLRRFQYAREVAEYGLTLFPEEKSWHRIRLLEKADELLRLTGE